MRMIPGSVHRLAWSLALVAIWSCKESASKATTAAKPSDSSHVAPRNPSDTSFSPAEIRRSGSATPDTSTVQASKTDSVVEAKPAAATAQDKAPVSKPEPPATKAPEAKAKAPAAAPPAPPGPLAATAGGEGPGSEGDWVLQINIHKSEAEARAQVKKLADQGIPAYAIPVPTGETKLSGDYWRVRVGRFKERARAQAWGEANIVPRGLKFWVDKKANENRSAGNP